MKTVGVINCTFHDQDQCIEFVNSVRSKDYKFQFYIRNNTPDLLEGRENLGYAEGMEEGIEKAYNDLCDYIYVGNADSQLYPDTLDILVGLLEKNPRYLCLSATREDEVNVQPGLCLDPKQPNTAWPKRGVNKDPDFAAFIFKRSLIDLLKKEEPRLVAEGKMTSLTDGLIFDKRIQKLYVEDDCLKQRISLMGYKFAKVNHAVFKHIVSYSSKSGHGEGARENWMHNFAFFKEKYGVEVPNAQWRHIDTDLSDFVF